jgi:hypothetical protein
VRKEFDPGKAATWRSGTPKTPLDDSYQKVAAGVVEHQHRITCVSIHPAYSEVEQLGSSTVDRPVSARQTNNLSATPLIKGKRNDSAENDQTD